MLTLLFGRKNNSLQSSNIKPNPVNLMPGCGVILNLRHATNHDGFMMSGSRRVECQLQLGVKRTYRTTKIRTRTIISYPNLKKSNYVFEPELRKNRTRTSINGQTSNSISNCTSSLSTQIVPMRRSEQRRIRLLPRRSD